MSWSRNATTRRRAGFGSNRGPRSTIATSPKTTFTDARDELYWLINNVAYSRPEDERPALSPSLIGCCDLHDDQTVADMLKTIKTAMIAAQPKHSKVDHQKYRRDQKTHIAMLRTTLEIDYAADDAGIDPGKRHAPKLVQSAMIKRAKDPEQRLRH